MYLPEPNTDRHYSLEQAAGLMGLPVERVLKLIKNGYIKAELSNTGIWYISNTDIIKQIIRPHKSSKAVKQKKFHKRYLKNEKGKAFIRDGKPSGWPASPEHSDQNCQP
jgi:hypothetical protein